MDSTIIQLAKSMKQSFLFKKLHDPASSLKSLVLGLVILFLPFVSFAQVNDKKTTLTPGPKLIVGIVVDQMRYDYVFRYWNKLSEGGFKKLMNEGFFCSNTRYNYVPTFTAPGHACIYTGTTPSINGIISNDWFRKAVGDTLYCVQDDSVKSVGSISAAGKMSPKNLLTSTVTDELRYGSGYKNKVIGISLKDRGAILPAGHSANAAYWYDGSNGNWITSTYYMQQLPVWVSDFNAMKYSDQYLSKPWTTLLPIDQYTESTADNSPYEEPYFNEAAPVFPHDFPKIKQSNYELVRRSPFGNTLTKDLAIAAIKNEKLGEGMYTDFLTVSFSSTDYVGHQFGCDAIETEDTYLRLDKDLSDMISYLDKTLGKNNYLVFLTADHAAVPNVKMLSEHGIPSNVFSMPALVDSLKKFMLKNYGEGNWISCLDNDQVFLNHELLSGKKIDPDAIADKIADFLLHYNGITHAVTAKTLRETEFNNAPLSLVQKGYNIKLSGDVCFVLAPALVDYKVTGTTHGSAYNYDTHVPLFFYGWKVPHGSSAEEVFTVDIAPTVSSWLNIDFPSGSTGKVLPFIIQH
jgi:predicted AlkP superfamily pyrophosphatase or phosphodiesterase